MGTKQYKLRVLPLFEDDLTEIVDYITLRLQNPIAAEKLVDALEAAIHERLPFAEAFEPYSSAKIRREVYYRIQVKNFTIFYVVLDDVMEVRRVLYSRMDLKKLL